MSSILKFVDTDTANSLKAGTCKQLISLLVPQLKKKQSITVYVAEKVKNDIQVIGEFECFKTVSPRLSFLTDVEASSLCPYSFAARMQDKKGTARDSSSVTETGTAAFIVSNFTLYSQPLALDRFKPFAMDGCKSCYHNVAKFNYPICNINEMNKVPVDWCFVSKKR